MKSYNFYKEILERAGYHEEDVSYFNGVPTDVTFVDDLGHAVSVGIQPTDEYDNELAEMEDGTMYTPDFDRMEGVSAMFIAPICNVAGFMDGDKSGIYLKETKPRRYALLDAIGGDDFMDYYPHKMDMFEKCLWIQNHIIEHEENILNAHIKNLRRIRTEFDPVFQSLDFMQGYSSLFDCTEGNDYVRSDSNIFVYYKHKHARLSISIETDCITGELKIDGKPYEADNFRQYIIDTFMKDRTFKDIDLEFRYLFDSDYNTNSWNQVITLSSMLYDFERGCSNVNALAKLEVNDIPEKDFGPLLSKWHKAIGK